MPAPRRNQAAWEQVAAPLPPESDARRSDVLTLAQVADRTGMSAETIHDCLFRAPVTSDTNPRRHLCRPAFRRGSTPLWSAEQVAAAVPLALSRRRREGHGKGPRGPLVKPGADVVGVRDIAHAMACHEMTVRKWVAGSYSASVAVTEPRPFPAPAGRRAQPPGAHAGNPETVFPRAEVYAWLRDMLGREPDGLASADAARAVYLERTGTARAVEREAELTAARDAS
jgi:hypothetical protein